MDWERVAKAAIIFFLWHVSVAVSAAAFYFGGCSDLSIPARVAVAVLCPIISLAAFFTGFEILRCEVTR